jgi:hypothetical protein
MSAFQGLFFMELAIGYIWIVPLYQKHVVPEKETLFLVGVELFLILFSQL